MEKIVITYSEMASLRECRRRHYLSYERLLRPKVESTKLVIGKIGHEALQGFFETKSKEWALDVYDCQRDHHIKRLQNLGINTNDDGFLNEFYAVRAALRRYLETKGQEHINQYEIIETERKFEIPILHPETHRKMPKAFFAGKIDALVRPIKTNSNAPQWTGIMEHKFLSSFNDDINILSLDLQITLYCYAIGRTLGEFPRIAIYNVIKKPKYKRKRNETLTEYENRVYSVLLDKPDAIVDVKITRNASDFQIAEQELYYAVKEKRRKNAYHYRNVGMHCNWKCAFKEICFHENPALIDSMYEQKSSPHMELL